MHQPPRHSPFRFLKTGSGYRSGFRFASALLIALIAVDSQAASDEEEVPPEILEQLQEMFDKTAAAGQHYCAIIVSQNGILRPNIENTELSSRQMGGAPGVASVVATRSSYDISIDQTIGFTNAPAGGGDNTAFSATYSGYGAANFIETPGDVPVGIKKGTTTVETHFIATRTADAFPAGNYAGELVLRCE